MSRLVNVMLLTAFLLLATGCGPTKPPEEAVKAAIDAVPGPEAWEAMGYTAEIKDSQMVDYATIELDRADQANGVKGSWCITISTLVDAGSGWPDMKSTYRVNMIGNNWMQAGWYEDAENCDEFKK